MKRRNTFLGKFFVLLLALFSLGSNLLFAGSHPDIREGAPSQETMQTAHKFLWATIENSAPEFSEAEYHFAGALKEKEHFAFVNLLSTSIDLPFNYTRDIRKSITSLTFPTHFFL